MAAARWADHKRPLRDLGPDRPTCNRMEQQCNPRITPSSYRGFPCSDVSRKTRFERSDSGGRGAQRIFGDGSRRWNESSWNGDHWGRKSFPQQERNYWSGGSYGSFANQGQREGLCFRGGFHCRNPTYHRCETSFLREHNFFHNNRNARFTQQTSSSSAESADGEPGKFKPHPLSRRGSPIYPLRTFTNWAKVKIIQQAVPDDLEKSVSVMDLGCSKGVDLKKWAHAKVHQVYLVDEDKQDMEECKRRFQEINNRWPDRFKASFINKDYAYDVINLPEEVDLVSCQFLVQRAFSTREEAVTLTNNVARALKTGGHFIVSMVNADKIKALIYKTKDRMNYSNGIFTVDLESPLPDECPEFDVKMLFRVDEKVFQENLVQMKTLENVMKEGNLELVWRRSFPELYEEARKDEEQKKLLITMGVVENGTLLMSVPELETADLYEAAMFRKMENQPKKEDSTSMDAAAGVNVKTEMKSVHQSDDQGTVETSAETKPELVTEQPETAPAETVAAMEE